MATIRLKVAVALQLVASGIVYLSTYTPTQSQISVLQRGLKSCPTPLAPNPGDLRSDMDRLHKRLRQIAFFDSPEGDNTLSDIPLTLPDPTDDNLNSLEPFKHRKFKLPAKEKGPPGPQNLESMIAANEYDFQTCPIHRSYHSNPSQSECKAIEELHKNTTFLIQPADKGGLCVLWGRDLYLSDGYRQLSDSKFDQISLTLVWIRVRVPVTPTLWCSPDVYLQVPSNSPDQDLHL